MEREKDALWLSAHLKYAEYLFNIFDTADENLTLKNIREAFLKEFRRENYPKEPLSNHFFGILKIVPLMYIREIYKKEGKLSEEDMKNMSGIRNAFAHGAIESSSEGYTFTADEKKEKKSITMTYEEFNAFLYRIENNFADMIKESWV
jgi:hypothetical protein